MSRAGNGCFSPSALRDIYHHANDAQNAALFIKMSKTVLLHPNLCVVRTKDAIADFERRLLRGQPGHGCYNTFTVIGVNSFKSLFTGEALCLIDAKYVGRFF